MSGLTSISKRDNSEKLFFFADSMDVTSVINIYHKIPYDVYCGRAGKGESGEFGNPTYTFEKFAPYFYARLDADPDFKKRVHELKGKKLGCFCAPKECHAMVYVEYLEGKSVQQQMMEYTERMGKFVQPNIFDDL